MRRGALEKCCTFRGNPNNPSDASLDIDGDGMCNLAEYLAGTNPKDASSYLRLTSVTVGGMTGVELTWGSASNKLYSVERTVALGGPLEFTAIAAHLISTPPENHYLDTSATNSEAFFYRIRLE